MKIKKVLAAVNDEITAIQINNLLNDPNLCELEFAQLRPQLIDEILDWQPDLVIFDTNLLSRLNGIDYAVILKNHNIPFLYINSPSINTVFNESLPSEKSYNFMEIRKAVQEALSEYPILT